MKNTGQSLYCCTDGGGLPVVNGCLITDCIRELTSGTFELRNTSNNPVLSIESNDTDIKIENKLTADTAGALSSLFIGAENNTLTNPAPKNVKLTVDGNDLIDYFGTAGAEQLKVLEGVRFNLGDNNTFEDTIDPASKSNTLLAGKTFNSTLTMSGPKIVNGNNNNISFTSGVLSIDVSGLQRQIYKDIEFTDTTINFTNTGGEVEFIDCDFTRCIIENTTNLSLYLKFINCRFFHDVVSRVFPYISLNTTAQLAANRLEVDNCFFNCENIVNNVIFNYGGCRHMAVRNCIFDEVNNNGAIIHFQNVASSTSLAEVVIRSNSTSLNFAVATYTHPFIYIGPGYRCTDFSVTGNYFKNINKTNPTLIQTSDIDEQDRYIFCNSNLGIVDYVAKSMNNQTALSSQQTSASFIEVPTNWTISQYIDGWNRGAIRLDGANPGQVIVDRPKNSIGLKISYTVRMFNNGISIFGIGISQGGSVVDTVEVNHNGPSETDKIITREFYTILNSASSPTNFYLVFRQTVAPNNFQVQTLNFTVEEI